MRNNFISATRWLCAVVSVSVSLSVTLNNHAQAADPDHIIVPGYERFQADMNRFDAGRLLISELNCQSCHGVFQKEVLPQRRAPILTNVGDRIRFEHLKAFIAKPQSVKPGTAMPHLLTGDDAASNAEALAQFLTHGKSPLEAPVSSSAVSRGETLFHSVGCAACHGDLRKPADERPAFAMPLGPLDQKYTVGSLVEFLKDPHAVRPSGRMPSLNLDDKEARDVASFLLKDIDVEPRMMVDYFEGGWQKLPDFDQLTAKSTTPATDFDVTVAPKNDGFALRFRGFVHIPTDGEYQFWLGSDDGSRLLIDGMEIVNVDGVHPHSVKDANANLTAGPHAFVVEYFENGGEESLSAEIAGPELNRQPLAALVSNDKQPPSQNSSIAVNPELVKSGQRLFTSLGCASCHEFGKPGSEEQLPSQVPSFAKLDPTKGCLSTQPKKGIPQFALSNQQRADIAATLASAQTPSDATATATANHQIGTALLTLNCYGCHQRNDIGGVPRELDHVFTGSIPEMGDEGRVPPHLDGIGDKLKTTWLTEVLNKGAKDRPYMATRMPKFGAKNVGQLIELFGNHDRKTEVAEVEFDKPLHRVAADARLMVGDQALSCIKCHYFGTHKATGIQSLDMTTMTKRLRRDWFHRYLLNPSAYRPGTRMPSAWPNGKSVVPHILHGNSAQQIEAIWLYLLDGTKARVPSGLLVKAIELKPEDRPIVYRNFIEGLSPRGIAVGYPERAHIAWDAEQMNLRLIWHGAFIDASKHWVGRGPGFQTPLGDHVMQLAAGQPLAVLDDNKQPWPKEPARANGFSFNGYRLNKAGQPTFDYEWNGVEVADFIEPIAAEPDASLRRTLTLTAPQPVAHLYARIAAATSIQETQDAWLIDDAIRLTFDGVEPIVRQADGRAELLVPITTNASNTATVRYNISW